MKLQQKFVCLVPYVQQQWDYLRLSFILSRVSMTVDGVVDWMIEFIVPYTFTQFGTTGNTALSLFYTLFSSPFHTH
jgi:hypothetical protein